ncbi:MAG: hypothetical protein AB2A00_18315 [Myxococcota bacterium]
MKRALVVVACCSFGEAWAQTPTGTDPCGGTMFAGGRIVVGRKLVPADVDTSEGAACIAHVARQAHTHRTLLTLTVVARVPDDARLDGAALGSARRARDLMASAGLPPERVSVVVPRGEADESPSLQFLYAERKDRPVARVDVVEGNLRVGPDDPEHPSMETVGAGGVVTERQALHVGAGAHAVLTLQDGSRWVLGPETNLALREVELPESRARVLRATVSSGTITVMGASGVHEVPVELDVGGMATRVQGCTLRGSVTSERARIETLKGVAAVRTADGTQDLRAGEALERTGGGVNRSTLLAAPVPQVVRAEDPARDLRWSPVEGATGYVVQLAREPAFARENHEIATLEPTVSEANLPPGRWFWRVSAVGQGATPGLPSKICAVGR